MIVADFLIICGDRFGDGAGGTAHYKKPARDFLSGADFGERAKCGWVKVQSDRFVVSVDFFSGRHSHPPVRQTVKSFNFDFTDSLTILRRVLSYSSS
jgi:hypothetical protein